MLKCTKSFFTATELDRIRSVKKLDKSLFNSKYSVIGIQLETFKEVKAISKIVQR